MKKLLYSVLFNLHKQTNKRLLHYYLLFGVIHVIIRYIIILYIYIIIYKERTKTSRREGRGRGRGGQDGRPSRRSPSFLLAFVFPLYIIMYI